jgi:hypothetical protein
MAMKTPSPETFSRKDAKGAKGEKPENPIPNPGDPLCVLCAFA